MSYSHFSRMGLAIALAAAALAPAQARTNNSTEAERSAATSRVVQPTAAAKERRYCIEADMTGTRMQKKVCKTKKEWADQGLDVDQPR